MADLQAVADAHAAPARTLPPRPSRRRPPLPELAQQPRGPSAVAPERFALLQALLAFLLARCGESASARVETAELELRFQLGPQELKESLELLNLVNFGGGCYAVYCHADNGDVVVDKELYGDAFRRPARLSPLEAKALLRALDVVAPLVAAEANSSLQTVRAKVEAAFGRFPLADTPMPQHEDAEEQAVTILNEGVRNRRLVDITYLSRSSDELSTRTIEPYLLRRDDRGWYVEAYDRSRAGRRTFKVAYIKDAALAEGGYEPRAEMGDLDHSLGGEVGVARVWFGADRARWELEGRPGTRPLDGRLGRRRGHVRLAGVADLRDPALPRPGRGARAGDGPPARWPSRRRRCCASSPPSPRADRGAPAHPHRASRRWSAPASLGAFAATAHASKLLDRNTRWQSLKVDKNRVALVTYFAHGHTVHALLWGAVNALPPNAAHPQSQVKFKVNYAGGRGSSLGAGYWRKVSAHNVCGPYTGPPLYGLVKACTAPDGSNWALQAWQRDLPDNGWNPKNFDRVRLGAAREPLVGPAARPLVQDGLDLRHGAGRAVRPPVRDVHLQRAPGVRVRLDLRGRAHRQLRPAGLDGHPEPAVEAGLPPGGRLVPVQHVPHPPALRRLLRGRLRRDRRRPTRTRPGRGSEYRITANGPGVTPVVSWRDYGPGYYVPGLQHLFPTRNMRGPYSAQLDHELNADQRAIDPVPTGPNSCFHTH